MKSCKEYLEKQPDGTYSLVLRGDLCKESDILIPEGAEIAIQFKNDPDEFGVIFYKNNGKSCMGESDNNWQHDSEWTMDKLLNENYHDGGINLSHEILWQRATHPEELPFIDDEPTKQDLIDLSNKSLDTVLNTDLSQPMELEYTKNFPVGKTESINDQYAEIEQARQVEIHGTVKAAQASGGVDATLTERQSQYGCYEDVAHVTQQILSALRVGNYDELPAPMKESLHMIASKMARIVNGDPEYLDNWHDIGGYAKLIEKLIKGE